MQCFQYLTLCFQYETYVSNIQFMFPNAFICFQYPIFVSNIQSMFPNANDVSKRQYFQCMFPNYIEPVSKNCSQGLPLKFQGASFAAIKIFLDKFFIGSFTGSGPQMMIFIDFHRLFRPYSS